MFSCDRVQAQLDSKQLSCSCAFGFAKVNAQKEVLRHFKEGNPGALSQS
jgi:hypothetical protein